MDKENTEPCYDMKKETETQLNSDKVNTAELIPSDSGSSSQQTDAANKTQLTQDQAMKKSLRVSYAIRTIAGFYLMYVAFRMYQTMDLNTGATKAVSNMFMLFFAIIGLVMIITSFMGNKKLRK